MARTSTPDMLATVQLTTAPGTNGTQASLPGWTQGCIVLSMEPLDNPDKLVSQQVRKAVDNAVSLFFLPVLFLLSVPANVVNMLVFWRHGVRERINLCLFCLSLADLLYMCYSFILNVDKMYQPFTGGSGVGVVRQFMMDSRLVILRGFSWESGFLSMLIACERCLCVYSPLRAQKIFKTSTTAFVIFVSVLVHHGFIYIGSFRWSTACVFNPVTNSTSRAIYPTKFYLENKEVLDMITGIIPSLVMPVSYTATVSITTAMTLLKLREVAAWREKTSSASAVSSKEVALTRMLIGISVLFVVCAIPNIAVGIVMLSVPERSTKSRYYNAVNLLVSFFELCAYINSSFNFFVYFSLGSKFKETLGEICFCCSSKAGERSNKAAGAGYKPSLNISNADSFTSTLESQ